MNSAAYLEMADTEAVHWWFMGRRVILSEMMRELSLPSNAKILEVGCGTGGNLQMLADFGEVSAFEMNDVARVIAQKKTDNLYAIKSGYCPDGIPIFDDHFDLICVLDVLEHIEKDVETLIALRKLLKRNGRILITVPAYQWLYGPHDRFLHHKRRYTAPGLREKIISAGLVPLKISYFNTVLFPLVTIVRLRDKIFQNHLSTGIKTPSALINKILFYLFSVERFLLRRTELPFGVSLIGIFKPNNDLISG